MEHNNNKHDTILIFDVETTGLPPKKKEGQPEEDLQNCPYITQLSYVLFHTKTYRITKCYNSYVKLSPDVVITPFISKLTGFTREISETQGRHIADILYDFRCDVENASLVVAHNIEFDRRMVEIEYARLLLNGEHTNTTEPAPPALLPSTFIPPNTATAPAVPPAVFVKPLYCTMRKGNVLCNLYQKNNPYLRKFPTLAELYKHLFGEIPTGLHNSMMDVIVCLRCFIKLHYDVYIHNVVYDKFINNAINIGGGGTGIINSCPEHTNATRGGGCH